MFIRVSYFYLMLFFIVTLFINTSVSAHGGDDHTHYTREQVAWQKLNNGALLVDVRTAAEFKENHLDKALHIPYKEVIQTLKIKNISKEFPIVLYCRSGNRAGKAVKMLVKAGYSNVHNGGGISALKSALAQPESTQKPLK